MEIYIILSVLTYLYSREALRVLTLISPNRAKSFLISRFIAKGYRRDFRRIETQAETSLVKCSRINNSISKLSAILNVQNSIM